MIEDQLIEQKSKLRIHIFLQWRLVASSKIPMPFLAPVTTDTW